MEILHYLCSRKQLTNKFIEHYSTMKKQLYLLFALLLPMMAMAGPITPEQAQQAAAKFLNLKGNARRAAAATLQQPVALVKNTAGQAMFYAVNVGQDGGFVLVSGSDLTDAVIGYADHGTLTDDEMPDNMRLWLEEYASVIQQMESTGVRLNRNATTVHDTWHSIAPMVKAKWNQNNPYNKYCPLVNEKQAPTGCVQTAAAQLVYYYKWPKETLVEIPATPYGPEQPVWEINWDKMYPTYKQDENDEEVYREVAMLMVYLGTAAKAEYDENSTSTYHYQMVEALKTYFNYDMGVTLESRIDHTYDEWLELIYKELAAQRPVFFGGGRLVGGHSFLLDGYDEDDFFHVNWGWGGTSDGYYRVSLLDPKEQGTGGGPSSSSYHLRQVIAVGLQPNQGNPEPPVTLDMRLVRLKTDPKDKDNYYIETTSNYVENEGYKCFAAFSVINKTTHDFFDITYRLQKNDGSVVKDYTTSGWRKEKLHHDGKYSYTAMPTMTLKFDPLKDPQLTDGDYKIFFICKDHDAEKWLPCNKNDEHYIAMHLDHANRKAVFEACSELKTTLFADEFSMPEEDVIVGHPCTFTTSVENFGDKTYHGQIALKDKKTRATLDSKMVDIEPYEDEDITFTYTPTKTGVQEVYAAADFRDFILFEASVNVVADPTTVSKDVQLDFDLNVTNGKNGEILDNRARTSIKVTNNTDQTYSGRIRLYYCRWNDNIPMEDNYYMWKNMDVPAHSSIDVTLNSVIFKGAEKFSFVVAYEKKVGVERINTWKNVCYTTPPYCTAYRKGGTAEHIKVTDPTIKLPADICAIDVRGRQVVNNIESDSPNFLIFADTDDAFSGVNVIKDGVAEELALDDGYPFYTPFAFTAKKAKFTYQPERYMNNDKSGWTTLTLPFAATGCTIQDKSVKWQTNEEGGDFWIQEFVKESGNDLYFDNATAPLAAYRPYLVTVPGDAYETSYQGKTLTFTAQNANIPEAARSATTGWDYIMKGTFDGISNQAGIYTLNADGSAFVLGTASVSPFHTYFVPVNDSEAAPQLNIHFITELPAGIQRPTVNAGEDDDTQPYYTLDGRMLSGKPTQHGIYIRNGRKVVLK